MLDLMRDRRVVIRVRQAWLSIRYV